MKLTKLTCALIYLLRGSRDGEPSHYAQRHKELWIHANTHALGSTDWTLIMTHALIIGGRFMGHLVKPAFAIAFRKNSLIVSSFAFTHCNVAESVINWEYLWSADALRSCLEKLYSNINVPRNNRPMKAARFRVFPHNNWTSTWQVSCFCSLKLLLFGPGVRRAHQFYLIHYQTKLPYGAYSVSHIPQSSFVLIVSDLSLACTRYQIESPFVRIWSCAPS